MLKKLSFFSLIAVAFTLFSFKSIQADQPEIGKPTPSFTLSDSNGKNHSISDFKGKHVILEWINLSCPFVRKHYDTANMQKLQKEWTDKGAIWLSIASSAEGKQGFFNGAKWNELIKKENASMTAVLLDPAGKVGKLYGAKTTPHMFVIDPKGNIIYKGAIDDNSSYDKDDVQGAKNYVSQALTESMANKPVSVPVTEPYGCSVKYK
ncbi:MAG: thioredoxin family protein [Elusimicrobiota bacterium]